MTMKNIILIAALCPVLLGSAILKIIDINPIGLIAAGLIVIFLLYALWNPPKKYRTFSYKDQQHAMRAFDRSEQIDMGIADLAKEKDRHKELK